MRETWVQPLGWEDPLEKGRVPTPVFLPREFHGLYSPWGHKELDTTKRLLKKKKVVEPDFGYKISGSRVHTHAMVSLNLLHFLNLKILIYTYWQFWLNVLEHLSSQ